MDDLAGMATVRVDQVVRDALQLVEHQHQQYSLVMTVVGYLVCKMAEMLDKPHKQAIALVIKHLSETLEGMPE